jgi:two-component system, OmpR family, response regulator
MSVSSTEDVGMEQQKHRILIIDDDYDNRQLTIDVLQYGGFDTYDFASPQLALDAFRQNPNFYDFVVIDIWLDELDGIQVYSEIKKLSPTSKVFIFTGMEIKSNEFKKICPSFDERQVIKKPIKVNTLINTITNATNSE